MYDAIVIGAGVVGCSVAQRLAQYGGRFVVVDQADDVSQGASKANSGIVHAGYDAVPGSEKARLNVKGAALYPQLCRGLGIAYGRPGALVLAFDKGQRAVLERLLRQAEENGVPGCRIVGREEALGMEPRINPQVCCALHAPGSGLVSPYELTCALADSAALNGTDFLLYTRVETLVHSEAGWEVRTDRGTLRTRAVVNCAGIGAGRLHNRISSREIRLIPRRGQYYLTDREDRLRFSMTLFQVPTKMGKGVLITPTTHGNLLLGPTAEDIDDGEDTATTRAGLETIRERAGLTWPGLSTKQVITTFSGIRAHEEGDDFIIGAVEGAAEGAFEAIGIESPGLTAAPAIGMELGDWVATWLQLRKNRGFISPRPLPKPFRHMNAREREEAWRKNPQYGHVVCRCEQVTEAEIRHAIRRPVGARSVDGVKRRARAGMGRCQGGFCSPRVMQILSEELDVSLSEITKYGGASRVLAGDLDSCSREACFLG